jgi:hypothetical protein
VFDPSLAPPGKAVVHAYYAANEPYDLWKGMDTKSAEYKALKEQRAEPLWKVGVCLFVLVCYKVLKDQRRTPLWKVRFCVFVYVLD